MRSIYTCIREVVEGNDNPEIPDEGFKGIEKRMAVTGACIALEIAGHERAAAMDVFLKKVGAAIRGSAGRCSPCDVRGCDRKQLLF